MVFFYELETDMREKKAEKKILKVEASILGRQDTNMIQAGFAINLVDLLQLQVILILHSSVCRCIGFTVYQLWCWADNYV